MIDPVLWSSCSNQILADLSESGLRRFWEEHKHKYLGDFVEFVDQHLDRGTRAASK